MEDKIYLYEFILPPIEMRKVIFDLNPEIVELYENDEIEINIYHDHFDDYSFETFVTTQVAMEKIMYYLRDGDTKRMLQEQIDDERRG